MCQGAAQDLHVQHAGQDHVVDVVSCPADEAVVLDPAPTCPEASDFDLVECHAQFPSSSICGGASPRIFCAAQSTAFTMFW